jgi:hypothetical protein
MDSFGSPLHGGADGVALSGSRPRLVRVLAIAALAALALGLAVRLIAAEPPSRVAPAPAHRSSFRSQGLLRLPAGARGPISAALGADATAYFVHAHGGALRLANPAQRLDGAFTTGGATVSSGSLRLGLALDGVGYGSALRPPAPAAPRADRNRVTYTRAGIAGWYANGPFGIEQGFTMSRAPSAGASSGPLTLALEVSGNTRASVGRGGTTATFAGPGGTLRYSGLSATDASGRTLRSWLALDGARLLLHVDAHGARYPLRIDPFIRQGDPMEGTPRNEEFGASVAVSADGNTALVGGGSFNAEGAFVFVRKGSTWSQQGPELLGTERVERAEFGGNVALSADGNTALIGGPADNKGAGAAWVFTRSGTTWTQQGSKLAGGGESGAGRFGDSVALSADGNTALVGAIADNGEVGAAWTFTRSGEAWTQSGEKLTGPGEVGKGRFGEVALSSDGSTALVGEAQSKASEGAAWAFAREGEGWHEQEEFTGVGGLRVGLSGDGNTAMIAQLGSVSVFGRSGETWKATQTLTVTGNFSAEFTPGVALSRNGQVALLTDPANNGERGAAFVFDRTGETWTQQHEQLSTEQPKVHLGLSSALSEDGSTAVVGSGHHLVDAFVNVAYAASAGPPEFGRCLPVNEHTGKWSTSTCAVVGTAGSDEFFPGAAEPVFELIRPKSPNPTLSPIAGSSMTCEDGPRGQGAFSGYQTVAETRFVMAACKLAGQPCTSAGAAEGELATLPLEGVLGVIKKGSEAAKNQIGLELKAASGPALEFSCGATNVSIRGAVIATALANKMTHPKLTWKALGGKQKPERFEGQPPAILEASVNGGPYAKVGFTGILEIRDMPRLGSSYQPLLEVSGTA